MLICTSVMGKDSRLRLSLEQAETEAWKFSPHLKAKKLELGSAQARADSQFSRLWPKISLEADWRYVTEIGSIKLPFPGQPEINLGDNQNYSVGPMLSWMVWDTGARYFSWKARQRSVQSGQEEVRALSREIKLETRLAYFKTQLALEQVRLLGDALKLAQAQYRDIRRKVKAGASSRIDELSSHQEVLSRQRRLRSAGTDLVGAIREILDLTGRNESTEKVLAGKISSWIENPGVLIQMDALDGSHQRLKQAAEARPDLNHPHAQRLANMVIAAQQAARSMGAGHWPQVRIAAKTSLDYPNGPILESFHQNMVGISASWDIFQGKRVFKQVEEQTRQAAAWKQQEIEVLRKLKLNWDKAQDRFKQLQDEQVLNRQAVRETDELAGLVYQSYKIGRSSYLEVQAVNLQALEAKTNFIRTRVQILIQLAMLDSLSERGDQ